MNTALAETLATAGEMLKPKENTRIDEQNVVVEDQGPRLGCAILTSAKWCPLENCTILVLGM